MRRTCLHLIVVVVCAVVPVGCGAVLEILSGPVRSGCGSFGVSCEAPRPFADAGPDLSAEVGQRVTLDGSSSGHQSGRQISFFWSLWGGPTAVMLAAADTAQPSFVPSQEGTYAFHLIVADGAEREDVDSVLVFVGDVNRFPIAYAGGEPSLRVEVGQGVTLSPSSFILENAEPLTSFWEQLAGPTVVLDAADSAQPNFVPSQSGVYEFALTATGALGGEIWASALVFVNDGEP